MRKKTFRDMGVKIMEEYAEYKFHLVVPFEGRGDEDDGLKLVLEDALNDAMGVFTAGIPSCYGAGFKIEKSGHYDTGIKNRAYTFDVGLTVNNNLEFEYPDEEGRHDFIDTIFGSVCAKLMLSPIILFATFTIIYDE